MRRVAPLATLSVPPAGVRTAVKVARSKVPAVTVRLPETVTFSARVSAPALLTVRLLNGIGFSVPPMLWAPPPLNVTVPAELNVPAVLTVRSPARLTVPAVCVRVPSTVTAPVTLRVAPALMFMIPPVWTVRAAMVTAVVTLGSLLVVPASGMITPSAAPGTVVLSSQLSGSVHAVDVSPTQVRAVAIAGEAVRSTAATIPTVTAAKETFQEFLRCIICRPPGHVALCVLWMRRWSLWRRFHERSAPEITRLSGETVLVPRF